MREEERQLLRDRLPYFQKDLVATELLDDLPCLSDDQKDKIAHDENNYRQEKAVKTLVDALETCEDGFGCFVRALLKNSLSHIAVLLDPECSESSEHMEDTEAGIFCVVGSAVDVRIVARIIHESVRTRNTGIEEKIAKTFLSSKSNDCKSLRKAFTRELPQGIHFVHTKQLGEKSIQTSEKQKANRDSVVFVFRIAQDNALDEFWKVYKNCELKRCIKKVLTAEMRDENLLNDMDLELLFQENDYRKVRKILTQDSNEEITDESNGEGDMSAKMDVSENAEVNSPTQKSGFEGSGVKKRSSCRVYLDGDSHKEIHLRDYQKELAEPAFKGENTIICAPTNSGKTFVAMEIAKRHLDEHHLDTATDGAKPRKVIFVVNKVNLVLQQRARFEDYLSRYQIADISGSNSGKKSLASLLEFCDVVVLTAQILVDALKSTSVKLRDISLLIFDECHHTQKENPYNKIMMEYIERKRNNDTEYLPQVVGLTASLGVGQSTVLAKAVEHVLQICANLDASTRISTVRDNLEDLKNHVTGDVPGTKVITVPNDVPNVFEREVNKAMKDIEEYLKKKFGITPSSNNRQHEGYRQWIENQEKDASVTQNNKKYVCAEQLRSYHEALLINNFTTVDDALDHLKKCFDDHEKSRFSEICSWLSEVYKNTIQIVQESTETISNPLLLKLESLIAGFHENDHDNCKGIVFCRTKAYSSALKRWVSQADKLKDIVWPDVLLGSGGGQLSLTQSEQESVIKKFKTGDVNVVIATSVAEEGLDISDCKYVIRYDVKTNEISRVQARGRIRAKEGTYVYLSDTRSRGADHELMNQSKETLMDNAIKEVNKMKTEIFKKKIKSIQGKALSDLKAKTKAMAKKSLDKSQRLRFLCRKCGGLVCHAHELRILKNTDRVVITKDIFKRMSIEPHKKPYEKDGISLAHKIYCKSCHEDWGVMLTTMGTKWPCLGIKGLKVQKNDQQPMLYKQWKDYPYDIANVETVEELNNAQESLGADLD